MLEVDRVSHSFGERKVLDDVSFACDQGQIVVVMGSSGGGKTTLLKCIAGLLKPTSGDIRLDGVSVVKNVDQVRPKLGLVFQYAALFDSMSVEENIVFGARRSGVLRRKDEKARVRELLADVGLEGIEKLMPDQLSGGMRKRVGLARALAMSPELLLYDEPTSGLDPITAYAIDELIVGTRDRRGLASVVVSHDVTSIYRVADRIAFLHEGVLHFWGTPQEFRESKDGDVRELAAKAQAQTLNRA